MKTIQMTIDEPLLKAVDRASKARKTTRKAGTRKRATRTARTGGTSGGGAS